jgi:pimeloyl-ACP methyl ester carboxylesterase
MRLMTATAVPADEGSITLPGARRLAYASWGDRADAAVLLFHGMPGSRLLCPDVEATRDRAVRLIAVDRPGYGRSTPRPGRVVADWADDVRVLLDGLGISSVSVIGWSSGGAYALACAALLGARVRSATLVAADAPLDDLPAARAELPEEVIALIERIRADPRGDARAAVVARCAWYATDPGSILRNADARASAADDPDLILRRRPDVRPALDAMFAEGARQGSAGYVDDWIASVLPWGFRVSEVACPVAVWWGDRDQLTDRMHAEHLAAAIPGARLRVIPGEGHSLPMRHWGPILDELR